MVLLDFCWTADLNTYFDDKLDGIRNYASTGDSAGLHEDTLAASLLDGLKNAEQIAHEAGSDLDNLPPVPAVPLTAEQTADKLFQGYLNAGGSLMERIDFLAQAAQPQAQQNVQQRQNANKGPEEMEVVLNCVRGEDGCGALANSAGSLYTEKNKLRKKR